MDGGGRKVLLAGAPRVGMWWGAATIAVGSRSYRRRERMRHPVDHRRRCGLPHFWHPIFFFLLFFFSLTWCKKRRRRRGWGCGGPPAPRCGPHFGMEKMKRYATPAASCILVIVFVVWRRRRCRVGRRRRRRKKTIALVFERSAGMPKDGGMHPRHTARPSPTRHCGREKRKRGGPHGDPTTRRRPRGGGVLPFLLG